MKGLRSITLALILLISIMYILSSCRKTWLCEEPNTVLICTRGTDTIYSYGALDNTNDYSNTYIQNLTNYYTSMGYTVVSGSDYSAAYINDKKAVETLEQNGVKCNTE